MHAVRADIATLDVEAIVTVGRGSQLEACNPGDARLIPQTDTTSSSVIVTVGPDWQGGDADEAAILASCYKRCIEIAEEHGVRSIALPAIATAGSDGYPIAAAAAIAIASVSAAVQGTPVIGEVVFCCHSKQVLQHYRAALMQPG